MTALNSKQSINFSLIENGWFHERNNEWPGKANSYGIKEISALKIYIYK